jgi:hypothetical protein
MEVENMGIKFPTDLVNQAKGILHENESFNELVVQALKQELRRRKAIEAHETILKIRSSVKQRTGFHPDPVPLIRQLREGEER